MSSAETQDSSQKPSPLFSLETLSESQNQCHFNTSEGIWYQIILSQSEGVTSIRSKKLEKKMFSLRERWMDRLFSLSEWKKSNYSETKYSLGWNNRKS